MRTKERKPPRMRDTFLAHYDQYRERDGQAFAFVRRVSWRTDAGYDREVGTLYAIRFSDGTEIVAWPEEVIRGTCACHPLKPELERSF